VTTRRLAALVLLTTVSGFASPAHAGPGEACRDQAEVAERATGVPTGLLLAIGKRESGQYDAQAGGVLPWPWAVNNAGEGHLFLSRQEAISYVAEALKSGSRSVDVGCFQINLQYHPQAFATLEEAFDPSANAAYAARFLTELYGQTASWATAVAYYHSANAERGVPYRDAVLATWRGLVTDSIVPARPPTGPLRIEMGIRVFEPVSAQFALKPVMATAIVLPVRHAVPMPAGTGAEKHFTLGTLRPMQMGPIALILRSGPLRAGD
jgi:hypothetical protein